VKVIVACEFSGIVREAFRLRGHDAWSIDLLPTEIPGQHITGDVRDVLNQQWDMMIAFPPCTHLAVSGARWYSGTDLQDRALNFIRVLMGAPIPKIAIENPVGAISTYIRKPTQIVEPYWFGHDYRKATCLWLTNLPKLTETDYRLPTNQNRISNVSHSRNRGKERSRTPTGLGDAMAKQWG
jgi:site-specific DNA-cytosine methylase